MIGHKSSKFRIVEKTTATKINSSISSISKKKLSKLTERKEKRYKLITKNKITMKPKGTKRQGSEHNGQFQHTPWITYEIGIFTKDNI